MPRRRSALRDIEIGELSLVDAAAVRDVDKPTKPATFLEIWKAAESGEPPMTPIGAIFKALSDQDPEALGKAIDALLEDDAIRKTERALIQKARDALDEADGDDDEIPEEAIDALGQALGVEKDDGGAPSRDKPVKKNQLGSFLRRRMKERDVSTGDLARAAGIDDSTMGQILRGEIDRPPERRLRGFARALGASVDELEKLIPGGMEKASGLGAVLLDRVFAHADYEGDVAKLAKTASVAVDTVEAVLVGKSEKPGEREIKPLAKALGIEYEPLASLFPIAKEDPMVDLPEEVRKGFDELRSDRDKLRKDLDSRDRRIAELETREARRELRQKAEAFKGLPGVGSVDELTEHLLALQKADAQIGADSKLLENELARLKGISEGVGAIEHLTEELGKRGRPAEDSVAAEVEKRARRLVEKAADGKLSLADATERVLAADRDLEQRLFEENRGAAAA